MTPRRVSTDRQATAPAADKHQHKQVLLDVNGFRANVDEGMAPVIRLLWERGIWTIASCQGDRHVDGQAYIGFASADDCTTFFGLLSRWLLDKGRARFGHVWDSTPDMLGLDLPPRWNLARLIVAPGPLEVGRDLHLSLAVSLVFPPADVKRIRKQLARRKP